LLDTLTPDAMSAPADDARLRNDGMPKELVWRYRRDQQVLYIRAEQEPNDRGYGLVWRHPDGTSRAVRVSSLAMLYDRLRLLEEQLGDDGWELLAKDQRAPNRLPTPICDKCGPQRAVETTQRSATLVHFRCTGCQATWLVPKPGTRASRQSA
jgi:hypothetical protein